MATGDHVRWRTATGTHTGIELGPDGPYTRIVRPDGGVAATQTRREVIAAAGTQEARDYAVGIARRSDDGMRVLTAAGLVENTPGVSTRSTGPSIPDVVGTITGVYGEAERQRRDAAGPQRGASPTTQSGTGNS